MRMIYRLPLAAYRFGLAGREHWLGMHWVLIVTTGRRTGRTHAVLVDRLGEDPARGRYFVQAAYGRRADWVRNVEAHPVFDAEVRGQRFRARMEEAEPREAARVMLEYVRAHPWYSPGIAWMLGYRGSLRSAEAVAAWLVENFGMFVIVRQPA
ncbi:MAG: nitroreductase/quinone reductase family protein [Candidatus Binatia bacterium]